ncbi:MAG: rhodanese-like domain-containing protein [Candidatus Binataceae bacterium]|nr:rhodanese-like domain-containing protein [Candidatus Binataceae bacterium]
MAIEQIDPAQAHETMKKGENAIYLDVRTEEEFDRGHPTGAINVPVVFIKGPGNMQPNDQFLEVVGKIVPKDQHVLVGCMSGGRSQRACEILEGAGYKHLANVRGGFGGARDGSGAVTVKGWRDAGLPVSEKTTDNTYAAMRRKAELA